MCALRALTGSHDASRLHVCVDCHNSKTREREHISGVGVKASDSYVDCEVCQGGGKDVEAARNQREPEGFRALEQDDEEQHAYTDASNRNQHRGLWHGEGGQRRGVLMENQMKKRMLASWYSSIQHMHQINKRMLAMPRRSRSCLHRRRACATSQDAR